MQGLKRKQLTKEQGIELYKTFVKEGIVKKGENAWLDGNHGLSETGIIYKYIFDKDGNFKIAKTYKPKKEQYRISISVPKAEHIEMKRLAKLRKQPLSKLLVKAFFESFK